MSAQSYHQLSSPLEKTLNLLKIDHTFQDVIYLEWICILQVKQLDDFSVFEHYVTFTFDDSFEIEDLKMQLNAAGVLEAA